MYRQKNLPLYTGNTATSNLIMLLIYYKGLSSFQNHALGVISAPDSMRECVFTHSFSHFTQGKSKDLRE